MALQTTRKGMEPDLYNAAIKGSADIFSQFNWTWTERTTPNLNNVLHVHVGKPLERCHKSKELQVSIEFIQAVLNHGTGYSLLWKQNANGDTPLHLAAKFCQREAVQEFLNSAGAVSQDEVVRLLRITNNKKDTALHEAARMGYPDAVKLLVEAVASSDTFQHQPNNAGETPLYLAAELGPGDALSSILNYCDPSALNLNHKGPCGRTVLHAAVLWGMSSDTEIIKKMMDIDKSLVRIQDDQGLTPLHCAAKTKGSCELLQVFLDYNDEADSAVYIQDNKGRTALHVATLERNWDGIKMLLTSYPDSVEIVDNKGQNVVHYAASLGCLLQIHAFTKLGNFGKLINDKDMDGNTPLHILVATDPHIPAHLCFFRLRDFIADNLVIASFNNQNLTAGDVLMSNNSSFWHVSPNSAPEQISPAGKRIWTNGGGSKHNRGTSNVSDEFDDASLKIKQKTQYHLVVAALIATVSFTAGFTLPGGVNQNPGNDLGKAVLSREAAFIAFLVSDMLAFMCSALAVICYFRLAERSSLILVEILHGLGCLLTTASLGAMMIAFLTVVCAMVSTSRSLVIVVIIMSLLFFYPYFYLLNGTFGDAMYFVYRCKHQSPEVQLRLGTNVFKNMNFLEAWWDKIKKIR